MIRLAAFLVWFAGAAVAQADVTLTGAGITAPSDDSATLTLQMDAITPYRVFTLDAPRRLVLDVAGLDAAELDNDALARAEAVDAVRAGPFRPGWTRIIFDLHGPLAIDTAGMVRADGAAVLTITLARVSDADFAARAGAPPDPGWEAATGFDPAEAQRLAESLDYIVLLDPAHGGIDPGAAAGGVKEADLTLIMATELAVHLNRLAGVRAVLARQGDDFVSRDGRLTLAHEVGADLVLSLHATADDVAGIRVATFGTVDALDLGNGADVVVAGEAPTAVDAVLGDLARAETGPEATRIAEALVAGLARAGVPLPQEPRVTADLPILHVPAFPAVAIVLGGLDHAETRAFLVSEQGRNMISRTIAETVNLLAR